MPTSPPPAGSDRTMSASTSAFVMTAGITTAKKPAGKPADVG
jgi:hypothetical protein